MTIPTQLIQGSTTHIKDGLPVTTVSNLGALTPASEAAIMQIKATADKALALAEGSSRSRSSEALEDTQNSVNESDYVVSFQRPTAENRYTWYRLYKSGWIEQGGLPTTMSTIAFPKEMLDLYYWPDVHIIANTSNGMTFSTRGYSLTTTGFSYYNAAIAIDSIRWEVRGFAKL